MNKWAIRTFLSAALVLAIAPATFGDTVTMKLTSPGGNAYGGVYIGPYTASMTGAINSEAIKVVCDDFSAHTWVGNPTWTANVTSFDAITSDNTKFGNQGLDKYLQVAWLTSKLLDGPSVGECVGSTNCRGDIQFAIWEIFTDAATPRSGVNQTQVNLWLSRASDALTSGSWNLASVADYRILTPVVSPTDLTKLSAPQEFIVRTPEGSALALLAGNMLGLVGLVRLFRRRRTPR